MIAQLRQALPSLIDTIPNLEKKTADEWAGPCPKCGGDDRFIVKANGKFWCRQCGWKGDEIDFFKWKEGVGLKDLAAKYLNGVPVKKAKTGQKTKTGEWIYLSANGEPFMKVSRYDYEGGGKDYYPRRFDVKPVAGMTDHIPYSLPTIKESEQVIIVEGEKCADALMKIGFPATTNPGGSGVWQDSLSQYFKNKDVVILPDNDESGRKHAEKIIQGIRNLAKSIKIVNLPGLPEKGDVADWIANAELVNENETLSLAQRDGGSRGRLEALVRETPEWKPGENIPGVSEPEAWPKPLLFGEIKTPEIPGSLLPGYLGGYCQAVTDTIQTPSGLAVMFGLSTVAACLQRRFEVCPYGDDYTEPLSLWTITALDPGNRKTAVKASLTYPLTDWESERAEILKPEIKRVNHLRDVNQKRIDHLKARAAKSETEDADRDTYLRKIINIENETPDEISAPRLWTDDVTPERLQALLADNGERMALLSDEGGIFEVMAGLYTGGKVNLNVFLQGHAGAPVRVDRQGRAVVLNKPALTFGLAVQTVIINNLASGSKTRFRGNGTLARFLYCIPKSTIGHRDVTRRVSIPDSVKSAYEHGIMSLLSIEPVFDEHGNEQARILTLEPGALQVWHQFSQYIESKQGASGEYFSIQDWTSKLPGASLRIAGLFHIIEHGPGIPKINQQTMERALDLCDLLICHAQAAFDLMGDDPASADAKAVLNWIVSRGEGSFSMSECYQGVRRFRNADRMDKALAALKSRCILKGPIKKSTGGRPTIHYQVNPEILQTQTRVLKVLKA